MTPLVSSAITGPIYELAEGILWDGQSELVRWVDIWNGRVLAARYTDGRLDAPTVLELGQTAGAVALASDGGLLIAGARGLVTVTPSGEVSYGPDLLGSREEVRLNDGSVDPQGRFVVGTLSLADDTGEEVLLRIGADGSVETLRTDIHLSNGIAFSPDGATIYHVDTLANTVSSHSYSAGSFDLDEQWITVLQDLPAYPDGLTVDSEGALWVAQWGGASVRRHSTDGVLLAVVQVAAAQVSCPAFVGDGLDLLAITTAQEGLDSFDDQAGAIFVADVGVSGMPVFRWAGSTSTPYWHTAEKEEMVE